MRVSFELGDLVARRRKVPQPAALDRHTALRRLRYAPVPMRLHSLHVRRVFVVMTPADLQSLRAA